MELSELIAWINYGAVIIGVGNDISGDDAFGPILARRLAPLLGERCIDAGLAPENWVGKILAFEPNILVIADAVTFDGEPGELRVFAADLLDSLPSTHGPGFGAMVTYIEQFMPDIEILVLACQPERVGLMEPLSAPVANAIDSIVDSIKKPPRP